jgi:hypothetical protein
MMLAIIESTKVIMARAAQESSISGLSGAKLLGVSAYQLGSTEG